MSDYPTGASQAPNQRGQAFVAIVAFVAIFLLGVAGLATDYTQIWAYRQMLQGAADAACQAGTADLFLQYESSTPPSGISFGWFNSGATFSCTGPTNPPCFYALRNLPSGFPPANVTVSFPSSLPGVSAIPGSFGTIAHPYMQVTASYPVPLSFTKIVSASKTVNISAKSGCGLNPVNLPVPLVILHPSASGALSVGGNAGITILGGPIRSIQVDSSSNTAVSAGSNVDLSKAGPAGTGADFAVFGGPNTNPGVLLGTGRWISPATPVGDPWFTVPTPGEPGTAGTATPVPFAVNGCPDPVGCVEFTGGDYSSKCPKGNIAPGAYGCLISPGFTSGGAAWGVNQPYTAGVLVQPTVAQHNAGMYIYQAQNSGTSGAAAPATWNQIIGGTQLDGTITWLNMGPDSTGPSTAIFDPGLYYVGAGGLNPGPNTTMRVSTAAGDGNSGVTFYFNTAAGTVSVGSNVGKSPACTAASPGVASPKSCVVSYMPDGSAQFGVTTSRVLQCTGGPANPPAVTKAAPFNGNILLGPCSGTYGGDGITDGKNRGFLFFQNRATAAQPSWGGGGQFLLSGFMYFHQVSSFGTTLTMNGGSGAGAYTLGDIVVDQLSMTGNSGINMILSPQITSLVLRPTLLE